MLAKRLRRATDIKILGRYSGPKVDNNYPILFLVFLYLKNRTF